MTSLALAAVALMAGQTPESAWRTQTLDTGITISAPGAMKPAASTEALKAHVKAYKLQTDNTIFIATVAPYQTPADHEPSALFTGMVSAVLKRKGAKLVALRDILINGWPGVAFTARGDSGLEIATHACSMDDKLVAVTATYAEGSRPPDADKFLDSFAVTPTGTSAKAGALLKPFPLGDSGLTGLFPRPPETHNSTVGRGTSAGTLFTFFSDYAMRSYTIGYLDMPASMLTASSQELSAARHYIADDSLRSLQATKKAEREVVIGHNMTLQTDFTVVDGWPGRMLTFFQGKRLIASIAFGPPGYEMAAVDEFLQSIKSLSAAGG